MKILVLDGNSIINRAFYGIKLLTTKDGRFTNGIYGFLNILFRLLDDQKPDAVAAAFDMRAPTFRHQQYDGYKAGRKGMPPELAEQMPILKELLLLMGYKTLECEGFEADDILGTLAVAAAQNGDECVIATGDRDSLQLVSDSVRVLLAATKMGRPEVTVYDTEKIKEVYGLLPHQLIEVKALMGDSSDNIPGVAGIGEKTALSLISMFGTLENIYENIDDARIKAGVRTKLLTDRDKAFLSRELGTICTKVPVSLKLQDYVPNKMDSSALAGKLAELELFKTIERLKLTSVTPVKPADGKADAEFRYVADENGLLTNGAVLDMLVLGEKAVLICNNQVCVVEGNMAADFLLRDDIKIRTHDSKPIYREALKRDANPKTVAFDSLLAGYLLNPAASGYSTERLAQEYGIGLPQVKDCPEELAETTALGAQYHLLCNRLESEIDKNGQKKLLEEIEIPLALVLADMENVGFLVDTESIRAYGAELDTKIQAITREIYELVGYEFNLNSPKQLGEALFVKLGLQSGKKTKSGFSTNAEVLEGLRNQHPAVALLLDYRQLAKLKSTYCDGLLKVVGEDGRIHSTLNQSETRTGRISSTEPNLQNIPVRSEIGRNLRKFFIAESGKQLCDADYSQIELRVLAHIANDKAMVEAFQKNEDIHTLTASQVFGVPMEEVTSLMRTRSKAVNFGIVYGIGAFSLSNDIGVSFSEAKQYIERYLKKYDGVQKYMKEVIETAKNQGYVETMFGRRRYLPELTATNANLRSFGERVAMNMPIQGTAADIIKIAMIRVYHRLKTENLDAKLILQVHDELIVEAADADAERAADIVSKEMQAACDLIVPMTADVHIGRTWYDAKG